MATGTLNEHTSVLAAILTDISDLSDTNFIYILSANKCQQQIRKNYEKNTLKQRKHQTKAQSVYKQTQSHVTKAARIKKNFMIPENESALAGTNRLVKNRSRNQDRSKSAPYN